MTQKMLDQIEALANFKDSTQDYYKLAASVQAIKQSMAINQSFLVEKNGKDQASVLIHIFGLLQSLFVSIDALYDMTKTTMNHKYAINVNMNKNLHELKYIRNDIVGHPTHRTYQSGGVGFSLLALEKTTMDEIVYETHLFKRKHHETLYRKINTLELIEDYEKEAFQIIQEVHAYLSKERIKPELSGLALQFLEQIKLDTFDYTLLQNIKDDYQSSNDLPKDSHNRLMWRINLLEMLDNWKETDQDKVDFIKYMKEDQALKVYQMTSVIEGLEPKLVELHLPDLLQAFYRFIKNDESLIKYLKTLKDYDHPYRNSDLNELMMKADNNPKVKKLLSWFRRQQNEHRVYTIGSVLEKFKKNVQ